MLDRTRHEDQTLLMPFSPKQRLLELAYPAAPAHVADMLTDGASWRTIAESVSESSGVTVSHESVRTWYGTSERAAS